MTISLITGGYGFIGSHMAKLLHDKGHEVRVIDNMSTGKVSNLDGFRVSHSQISDINTIDIKHGVFTDIDYLFHFAGIPSIRPSLVNPTPYMETNAFGTSRMLEAARHASVKKFVYAASSACYGEADVHPTPETAEIKLQHPYGLSKHLGEVETLHWGEVFGLPVVSLRMFDVFGRRADSTVVGIFQRMKAAGKPITIFGDGNQTRDFVDVKDVCRAYLIAAESDISGEVFNVGTGNPQTINHLVDLLGGEKTYLPKRENEPYEHCADITKIKTMLGWEPQISFEDTINDILQDSFPSSAA
jgi:UDP-glucose 4-epimerase